MIAGLTARRIAYFIWKRAGIDPEDTMGGSDHLDRAKYAEVLQKIIDGEGPEWVLEAVTERKGFVFQGSNSRIGENDMKIGDNVRVDKCDACEAIIGKTGKIKNFADDKTRVVLNFGKGRPPKGRPEFFPVGDLTNVSDPIAEVNV